MRGLSTLTLVNGVLAVAGHCLLAVRRIGPEHTMDAPAEQQDVD